ncbi:MAG: hypothetical protein Q7S36_00015 [Candidatus Liptonbacteria bacterium]|nr:hypothetical protein [Candidatus Liptonbacteria bacterium]
MTQKKISDREFVDALNICLKHYSVGDVANSLNFSIPTVRRWSQGKNLPYKTMRPSVLRGILSLLQFE